MADEDVLPAQVEANNEPVSMSMAEFLENIPPNETIYIEDLVRRDDWHITTPEVRLHCSHESCNGTRFFRFSGRTVPILNNSTDNYVYLTYRCANCQKSAKIFSLQAHPVTHVAGECYKLGERPVYGPPTPSRLISLIGPDREIFLKGRRCENQGLGIGAFVYYRRVVENQKNRILTEIVKVSEKLGADSDLVKVLKDAIKETQFSKALDSVKNALPQSLLINGHNPMTLLHSALSEGLHAQTDERCLEIAHAVRIVLAELAERLGQALKDEAELNTALSRLMTKE
jgi:hypothetical protein